MYLFGGEKLPRRVLTQKGLVCSASNVHVVPLTSPYKYASRDGRYLELDYGAISPDTTMQVWDCLPGEEV
jgi:hypothetical protein